jgi:hypothetical protein
MQMKDICTVKTAIGAPCLAFREGFTEPSEPNSPKPLVDLALNPENFISCMFKLLLSFSVPPEYLVAVQFSFCFYFL